MDVRVLSQAMHLAREEHYVRLNPLIGDVGSVDVDVDDDEPSTTYRVSKTIW